MFRSEKDKPAVINIEHDEKHSDFMMDSEVKYDVGEVSISLRFGAELDKHVT